MIRAADLIPDILDAVKRAVAEGRPSEALALARTGALVATLDRPPADAEDEPDEERLQALRTVEAILSERRE